jgi:hypothetical protein
MKVWGHDITSRCGIKGAVLESIVTSKFVEPPKGTDILAYPNVYEIERVKDGIIPTWCGLRLLILHMNVGMDGTITTEETTCEHPIGELKEQGYVMATQIQRIIYKIRHTDDYQRVTLVVTKTHYRELKSRKSLSPVQVRSLLSNGDFPVLHISFSETWYASVSRLFPFCNIQSEKIKLHMVTYVSVEGQCHKDIRPLNSNNVHTYHFLLIGTSGLPTYVNINLPGDCTYGLFTKCLITHPDFKNALPFHYTDITETNHVNPLTLAFYILHRGTIDEDGLPVISCASRLTIEGTDLLTHTLPQLNWGRDFPGKPIDQMIHHREELIIFRPWEINKVMVNYPVPSEPETLELIEAWCWTKSMEWWSHAKTFQLSMLRFTVQCRHSVQPIRICPALQHTLTIQCNESVRKTTYIEIPDWFDLYGDPLALAVEALDEN